MTEAKSSYWAQPRPEMAGFVPERRARVLEIGCAEGRFLTSLPGIEEAWGIEPSDAAAVAGTHLHKVFHGTFADCEVELPKQYFDVVICNDVIEHMPDHDAFFAKISAHIAPGGVIVGSIPNVRFYKNMFQFLFEKDWHYTESGILDRTHLRFFTEKSFRKCLASHGLNLQGLSGLKENIVNENTMRGRAYALLARLLIVGSLGYYSDIQYLQFAFRAAPLR